MKKWIRLGSSSETVSKNISNTININDLIILNPPADIDTMISGRPF
jgi:hypothetical protein